MDEVDGRLRRYPHIVCGTGGRMGGWIAVGGLSKWPMDWPSNHPMHPACLAYHTRVLGCIKIGHTTLLFVLQPSSVALASRRLCAADDGAVLCVCD